MGAVFSRGGVIRATQDFHVNGSLCAQILPKPLFSRLLINPYTRWPMAQLHRDQMDEIVLCVAREEVTVARMHAKPGLLKLDLMWEMLYFHPIRTDVCPRLSRWMVTAPSPVKESVVADGYSRF